MLIRLSNYLESQLLQPKQENTSAQIYYSNITIPHVLHVVWIRNLLIFKKKYRAQSLDA